MAFSSSGSRNQRDESASNCNTWSQPSHPRSPIDFRQANQPPPLEPIALTHGIKKCDENRQIDSIPPGTFQGTPFEYPHASSSSDIALENHGRESDNELMQSSLHPRQLKWFQNFLQGQSPIALAISHSYLAVCTWGADEDPSRLLIMNMNMENGKGASCCVESAITHLALHSVGVRYNSLPLREGEKTWVIFIRDGCIGTSMLDKELDIKTMDFQIAPGDGSWVSCFKPVPGYPFVVYISESQTTDKFNVNLMDLRTATPYQTVEMTKPFTSLDVLGRRVVICAGRQCQVWDWFEAKLITSSEMDEYKLATLVDETCLLFGTQNDGIQSFDFSSGTLISTGHFLSPNLRDLQHLGRPSILSIKAIPESDITVCIYSMCDGSYEEMTVACFYDMNGHHHREPELFDKATTILYMSPNRNLELLHRNTNSSSDIRVLKNLDGLTVSKALPAPSNRHVMGYDRDRITFLGSEDTFFVDTYRPTSSGNWELAPTYKD